MPQKKQVITGLERLLNETSLQRLLGQRVGLLTNSAAVTNKIEWGVSALKRLLGPRLVKLFGPQHGLLTTVQDNMVETSDTYHSYWKLPVYSLYSHLRAPSEEMLADLDTVIIDMQDIGGRVYTYIYTMSLMMESISAMSAESRPRIIVLDRPNPVGGEVVEGNLLEPDFRSFVGRYPIPVRHGMTIAEVARFFEKYAPIENLDLITVSMLNWKRSMSFTDTGLPFVIPSPNIAVPDAAYTFLATVLFEGTNISEGRGTVRALEMVGHPNLDPWSFLEEITPLLRQWGLTGMVLRPTIFIPTFNKHQGIACGGFQIHVTDAQTFRPWRLGQLLLSSLYQKLGDNFSWKLPPYEYEYKLMPIDLINGTDSLRHWVEQGGDLKKLEEIEFKGRERFMAQRKDILLY